MDLRGEQAFINGKEVNLGSLEIDGVDSSDYPDFCDAYVSCGEFVDGTEMTDDELEQFDDKYGMFVHELAHQSFH